MKTYKKQIVPETTKDVVDQFVCDMCGANIPSDEEREDFEYAEPIKICKGYRSPWEYSGNRESVWVDLCLNCFKSKLLPWLESQGCKLNREDVDW